MKRGIETIVSVILVLLVVIAIATLYLVYNKDVALQSKKTISGKIADLKKKIESDNNLKRDGILVISEYDSLNDKMKKLFDEVGITRYYFTDEPTENQMSEYGTIVILKTLPELKNAKYYINVSNLKSAEFLSYYGIVSRLSDIHTIKYSNSLSTQCILDDNAMTTTINGLNKDSFTMLFLVYPTSSSATILKSKDNNFQIYTSNNELYVKFGSNSYDTGLSLATNDWNLVYLYINANDRTIDAIVNSRESSTTFTPSDFSRSVTFNPDGYMDLTFIVINNYKNDYDTMLNIVKNIQATDDTVLYIDPTIGSKDLSKYENDVSISSTKEQSCPVILGKNVSIVTDGNAVEYQLYNDWLMARISDATDVYYYTKKTRDDLYSIYFLDSKVPTEWKKLSARFYILNPDATTNSVTKTIDDATDHVEVKVNIHDINPDLLNEVNLNELEEIVNQAKKYHKKLFIFSDSSSSYFECSKYLITDNIIYDNEKISDGNTRSYCGFTDGYEVKLNGFFLAKEDGDVIEFPFFEDPKYILSVVANH